MNIFVWRVGPGWVGLRSIGFLERFEGSIALTRMGLERGLTCKECCAKAFAPLRCTLNRSLNSADLQEQVQSLERQQEDLRP